MIEGKFCCDEVHDKVMQWSRGKRFKRKNVRVINIK